MTLCLKAQLYQQKTGMTGQDTAWRDKHDLQALEF